jgi:cysteine desulfurase / selenocysteine lyase
MSERDPSLPKGAPAPRSQSDPTAGVAGAFAAAVESLSADPAAIERMANEFFRALPGVNAASPDVALPSAAAALFAAPPLTSSSPTSHGTDSPGIGAPGITTPLSADAPAQGVPNEAQAVTSAASHSGVGTAFPSDPVGDWTADLDPLLGFATIPDSLTNLNFLDSRLEPGSSLYFLNEPRATAEATPVPLAENARGKPRQDPYRNYNFRADSLPDLKLPPGLFSAYSARRDFPILRQRVHGKPLIWLDNAATTQKPQAVIDRISRFYETENSNIHRAAHALAARATDAYEAAREKVRRFLNAPSTREIVFVRGATEGVNLVAQSWGRRHIGKDDEIVITWLEHHSNIVPWQLLAAETGAKIRVAPVDDSGQILLDEFEKLLGPRTRLVSFAQVSNALGTVTPVRQMVQIAHRYGARVLVDGAQAVSHMRVDVQALDCDFYVFSGHKVFGPTGIGVVYGKPDALEASPPWQGGGNMITDVTFEKSGFQHPPARFEAGTGNIADAVGLGAALDYLQQLGIENVTRHEHDLLKRMTEGLLTIPGLRLIGTAPEKAGVISFVIDGFRTEDIGAALDLEGIAVRAGHHCAQPILRRFGVETTVRPSLALYNTTEDVDALIDAVRRLRTWGDTGRSHY